MNNVLEVHIGLSTMQLLNTATTSNAKYKVVYQPCNDNEGQQDHNMKDQIKCDNCHNSFDFFWCAGHHYGKHCRSHCYKWRFYSFLYSCMA